jgi:hypothetical protein
LAVSPTEKGDATVATTYHDPTPWTTELLRSVIEEYFLNLAVLEPALVVDIRMATSDKPGTPAVKHHGHECFATIEIVKPKERSRGGPDLRITIDREKWDDAGEETRTAVLHHELSHCVPQMEKDSDILKLDPYGRPVVKLRPDDWCLTGFRETVCIFGDASIEKQSLARVEEMLRQPDLPFMGRETESGGKDDLVRDTLTALISVGHTESQARAAMDRVLSSGRRPPTVSQFVDAIYNDNVEHGPILAEKGRKPAATKG